LKLCSGLAFFGGDIRAWWGVDRDMQVDAMALLHLSHHRDAHAPGDPEYVATLEDLRLMVLRPASTSDLAYLHGKIHPRRYTKPGEFGLVPEERSEELQVQVDSLFVRH